jgi:hypothetical protein
MTPLNADAFGGALLCLCGNAARWPSSAGSALSSDCSVPDTVTPPAPFYSLAQILIANCVRAISGRGARLVTECRLHRDRAAISLLAGIYAVEKDLTLTLAEKISTSVLIALIAIAGALFLIKLQKYIHATRLDLNPADHSEKRRGWMYWRYSLAP